MNYMIEKYPSVWISNRAHISPNILLGKNIHIFGYVEIAENTVIESNVVIGHPPPISSLNRNYHLITY